MVALRHAEINAEEVSCRSLYRAFPHVILELVSHGLCRFPTSLCQKGAGACSFGKKSSDQQERSDSSEQ
jgi:hypothetical protein